MDTSLFRSVSTFILPTFGNGRLYAQPQEFEFLSIEQETRPKKVPSVNNISKSTFYYNAVQDWNQLLENIKNKKTLYGFRKEIKSFLNSLQIQKENSECVM